MEGRGRKQDWADMTNHSGLPGIRDSWHIGLLVLQPGQSGKTGIVSHSNGGRS